MELIISILKEEKEDCRNEEEKGERVERDYGVKSDLRNGDPSAMQVRRRATNMRRPRRENPNRAIATVDAMAPQKKRSMRRVEV